MYCLDKAGRKLWEYKLPSVPLHAGMTKGDTVIITLKGQLRGISGDNGAELWKQAVPGKIFETTIGPDLVYVVTAMAREEKAGKKVREMQKGVPDSSRAQMMKEIMGVPEDENLSSFLKKPDSPTLIGYDINTGREKWRKEKMRGDLVIHEKGFILVKTLFGIVALISGEQPTFISSYSSGKCKQWWMYKSELSAGNVKAGRNSVFLTTMKWRGSATSRSPSDSTIHAVCRRGLINKLRKF